MLKGDGGMVLGPRKVVRAAERCAQSTGFRHPGKRIRERLRHRLVPRIE
jgi:hypothetical protein